MIASVLEAALPPGMVLYRFVSPHQPLQEDAKQHVASGGIVIDREHCQAFGVEIGQDGLHIYARLVQGLHLASRDGAFAVQCLRKMLASWNPCRREATPQGELALELEGVEPKTIGWLTLSDSPGETCADVLAAYFGPDQTALPSNALQLLKDNISNNLEPPQHCQRVATMCESCHLARCPIYQGRAPGPICLLEVPVACPKGPSFVSRCVAHLNRCGWMNGWMNGQVERYISILIVRWAENIGRYYR